MIVDVLEGFSGLLLRRGHHQGVVKDVENTVPQHEN